ncbi:MAG: DUF4876 domain-containing protein [Prevotella sp.]|nr:DUF4876 domain-containing protein [Prevotella sp.]
MKQMKYLLSLFAVLALASCVDYSDASQAVTAKIQLQLPAELKADNTLSGHRVSLQLNGVTYTALTDEAGIATFPGLIPDVYTVSTSWDISSADYARLTGSAEANSGATVSGSLNAQLISGSEPLLLGTSLSVKRDIIIGKVYVSGSKDNNRRNYQAGKYVELYNQSADTVDVAGLYIGLLETDNPQAYTLDNLHADYADSVVLVKQVFRIPADRPYRVAPGGTVVLTNSAIDHSVNGPLEHNLLLADFEAKDNSGRMQNNPSTPALETVFNTFSGNSTMNLNLGFQGVVIFRTSEDVSQLKLTYKYGKTKGLQFALLPKRYIIDGVDYLRHKPTGTDAGEKRLYPSIDAGFISINATSGWSGEIVCRRTSSTADGHRILMDTNNSSNDFRVSTTIAPREY